MGAPGNESWLDPRPGLDPFCMLFRLCTSDCPLNPLAFNRSIEVRESSGLNPFPQFALAPRMKTHSVIRANGGILF
jgi:hypothetical protein